MATAASLSVCLTSDLRGRPRAAFRASDATYFSFRELSPRRRGAKNGLSSLVNSETPSRILPSRGRILEGVSEFTKEDSPFFAPLLLGESSLKEKYVASLALKAALGRPLKSDVKQTDKEAAVAIVAENWKAYVREE